MNENKQLWDALRTPPASALRPITAGRLKGKTDIDPMWRWEALTERFGPCGLGWRFEVAERWTDAGPDGQVFSHVAVDLYYRHGQEWSGAVRGYGGSMLVDKEQRGLHANDEAFKMALTDALGSAAKMIGLAADVYMGRLDGSKYQRQEAASFDEVPIPPAPKPGPPSPQMAAAVATVAGKAAAVAGHGTDWAGTEQMNPDKPACPKCRGQMWDNREPERGGKGQFPKKTAKQPDFKCRDKDCGGVYWPAHGPKMASKRIEPEPEVDWPMPDDVPA